MGRKVFISFLGTTNYVNINYRFQDGWVCPPTRFIQEALIRRTCVDWSPDDAIYIFCTSGEEGSYRKNWLDDGHPESLIMEDIERIGLRSRLDSLGLAVSYEMVETTDNVDNHWSIFDKVYSVLCDGDVVYFDVTHAFRSIPMFSSILFNYAAYTKHTKLQEVHYGAFEVLGSAAKVRALPLEERIAPVIDLSDMVRLNEVAIAAHDLDVAGKMASFADSLEKLYRETNDSTINQLKQKLTKFDEYIATCNMQEIQSGKLIGEILNSIKPVRKRKKLLRAQERLIDKMLEKINVFSSSDTLDNIEAAIEWARKHNMLQQAYTMAEELTITKVKDIFINKMQGVILPLSGEEPDVAIRNYISALLGMKDQDVKDERFNGNVKIHKELSLELLNSSLFKKLRPDYIRLQQRRNVINHGKKHSFQLKQDFKEIYKEIKKVLSDKGLPCFINLSNHPSASWPEEQLAAAREFGEIIDMAFPQIADTSTEEDIFMLVSEYCNKIQNMTSGQSIYVVVHVMGEMTFTYALVKELKLMGYTCVASTSKRIVEEHGDGTKTVKFEFCKFRRYV